MAAKIHIERMMHRNSIAVAGESAASYALVKLIPTGLGDKPMPLNLALVLDVSGSMYEEDGTGISRLKRIQDAAVHAIGKLKPEDTLSIVDEEFKSLAASAFLEVEVHIRPMKDVKIKRVRQVVPEIKELALKEPEERHLVAALGTLTNQSTRYVLDLSLPKRADGKYVIAQIEFTYDPGTGKRETTGPIPLEV